MLTDGLLECNGCPFHVPQNLYDVFFSQQNGSKASIQDATLLALQQVHQARGRDSATLITWGYENAAKASLPSQ
jgi:hypothetical protein